MITILLCAGFGMRMYPLTEDRPKALLPVADRPVIDYLVDQLLDLPDLTTIHLVTNGRFHQQFEEWGQQIKPRLQSHGKSLQLHNDGAWGNQERLGANGDLALVLEKIGIPAGALVSAGDNILRFDLRPVWDRFLSSGRDMIIALAESDREKLKRTGVLVLDDADRVIGFHEKPAEPPSQWTCPPFYFLGHSALEQAGAFLTQPNPPDAMGYLIQFLIDKRPVYAYKTAGERLDIGNLVAYVEPDEILSKGKTRG